MAHPQKDWCVPPRAFLRMCRRNSRRAKVADTTGLELTGAGLLLRTLIVRRLLRREVLGSLAQERHVGLLLPPTVAAVIANGAMLLDRCIAVNLNYTLPCEVLNECIAQGGIRHVLTSHAVMERLTHLRLNAEIVYLEDLPERATRWDKLVAATQTWLAAVAALERCLGLHQIDPDEVMTVIFTSGSTGEPKGVMLSHYNVGSNIESFSQALGLDGKDVLIGVLPFFHSFGYTVTMLTGLMLDPKVIYHFNPLEYKMVGARAPPWGDDSYR